MFAALIAVGAFIKIDIPLPAYTMHFTLQWFFVLMSALMLGARLGGMSVFVYLALGLVGVPVFAAGGGPQYVFRAGFGFLLGFLLAALIMGSIAERSPNRSFRILLVASVIGLFIYYLTGAVYFYLIKSLYANDPVPFGIIVVQYCLITVLPDFALCVLAAAISCKHGPRVSELI